MGKPPLQLRSILPPLWHSALIQVCVWGGNLSKNPRAFQRAYLVSEDCAWAACLRCTLTAWHWTLQLWKCLDWWYWPRWWAAGEALSPTTASPWQYGPACCKEFKISSQCICPAALPMCDSGPRKQQLPVSTKHLFISIHIFRTKMKDILYNSVVNHMPGILLTLSKYKCTKQEQRELCSANQNSIMVMIIHQWMQLCNPTLLDCNLWWDVQLESKFKARNVCCYHRISKLTWKKQLQIKMYLIMRKYNLWLTLILSLSNTV